MNKTYITAAGKFFPNEVVGNEQMEDYLGKINGTGSRTRNIFLRKNGIRSRYYALDLNQQTTHTAYQMAANAIADCLDKSSLSASDVDFLSAGTTQSDLPVPGFASMVHGSSALGVCGIASHQSVCAAGIMALQNAFLQVQTGEAENAICCAGEMASRMFKSQRFEQQSVLNDKNGLPVEIDFLRWMLSDGAGALLLQSKPQEGRISLEIDWVDVRSYAHQYDVCMYAGGIKNGNGAITKTWLDYENVADASVAGAVNLVQDMQLVDNIVKLGVKRFFELIDENRIDPKNIDWLVCHYSSHHFKPQIIRLLEQGGLAIEDDKWFTNLYTKGNVGSASIYVMLEELLYSGKLKNGQKIICMVPESGRFITGFMQLTVVLPDNKKVVLEDIAAIKAPEIKTEGKPVQEWLVRQLTSVWFDFESSLQQVPVVRKIFSGDLSLEAYRRLLLNLRQQVIDGSQWIARAASNVSMEYFSVRSSFIRHSSDEHKDYQILEKNFVNCGGKEEDIYAGEKNIGSEALSAFMFHRASQPNPFDLLGAMFIIEGLGNRVSGKWGRAIKEQLNLQDNQVSFFLYHESSDSNDNHFERFEKAIQSDLLTETMARKIVKTAKVVARLYRMQLEELDNF
jgi:3-oxoacyl-[acyl-carrier-protein] synthase-3